ncbi:MAG TPA: hypothetical protein VFZ21_00355 [Gemmatimonadaceae bacterium]|jgi:hypothetical protein|nr:hypothetical protein [Gemmatimonadaceae bacterium]
MAEIKVEPKRGGLGWLWAIVLIALLAAAAWYLLADRGTPATTSPADSVRTSMTEPVSPAISFGEMEGRSNG